MQYESKAAKTDAMWLLGYTLLCLGLGGWFLYDWKFRYPAANRTEAFRVLELQMKALSPSRTPPAELPALPTNTEFDALIRERPTTLAEVNAKLGEPLFSREESGSTNYYYPSEWGMATVPVTGGKIQITAQSWRNWYKSHNEVEQQLYLGIGVCVIGLYFVYRTIKAMTLQVRIDDQEMNYGGLRIPLSSMTRLVDYSPKGWVDLYYSKAGGEKKLRLDNQKVEKFDEAIETICRLKGYPDPRGSSSNS